MKLGTLNLPVERGMDCILMMQLAGCDPAQLAASGIDKDAAEQAKNADAYVEWGPLGRDEATNGAQLY